MLGNAGVSFMCAHATCMAILCVQYLDQGDAIEKFKSCHFNFLAFLTVLTCMTIYYIVSILDG